ncbi:MAG: ABC transporter ATP-binding protein [Spirochaetales bacterium]|nr:ABC transporter ATP-binding protein [Spirochaetales bacterium]
MKGKSLKITDLALWFNADRPNPIKAIDGLNLEIPAGTTLALVGESGCGKTMTGLSIIGLTPAAGEVVRGSITLGDHEVTAMSERELSKIRGTEVAMIFQEPMTSLNPLMTIGKQLTEAMEVQLGFSRSRANDRARDLLHLVGFANPRQTLGDYPHRLSGGMRQRVMIALALACEPSLLIADEPTTALDVTIQAQVLAVLRHAVTVTGISMLLITHDLAVVSNIADRVAVMYSGSVVENATTTQLFADPSHPYTRGLLAAIPTLDREIVPLRSIPGGVPDPAHLPVGCRFAPRCSQAFEPCGVSFPRATNVGTDHRVHCFLYPQESK